MQGRDLTSRRDWAATAIPVALIVTGLVLVGGDWLGILSLDGIRNFWPLALITVGILEWVMPIETRHNRER